MSTAAEIAFMQLDLTASIRNGPQGLDQISDPELLTEILNVLVEYFDALREEK